MSATEKITVIVEERGSRTVRRNIEDIGKGANSANSAVNLLRNTLLALGGGAAVMGVLKMADSYKNLQNRLRTVTDGHRELKAVTQELFAISNRTRQSFGGTAELYARIGAAAKELGVSQQDVLDFTESMNKAVALSGATAVEAENALIQLSQGMASGVLRGDELRSVLEQLPAVADVIAKQMGITRGRLREMGEQGLITAQTIMEAFKNAREEINEKFAKSVPTVSQAFVVLKNNMLQWIGEADAAKGITEALATSIMYVANNFDTLARVAGVLAFALGTLVVRAAAQASAAILLLMFSNPFTAILTVLTTVIGALYMFSDQIMIGAGNLINLGHVASTVWGDIVAGVSWAWGVAAEFFDSLARVGARVAGNLGLTWQSVWDSFAGVFQGMWDMSFTIAEGILGVYAGMAGALMGIWGNVGAAWSSFWSGLWNGILVMAGKAINGLIDKVNGLRMKLGMDAWGHVDLGGVEGFDAGTGVADLKNGIIEGFQEGFAGMQGAIQDPVESALKGVADYAGGVMQRAGVTAQNQRSDNALIDSVNRANQPDLSVVPPGAPGAGGGAAGGGGKGSSGAAEKTFQDYLNDLREEGEALAVGNSEREKLQKLLQIEESLKRNLTAAEKELVMTQLELNEQYAAQGKILDELRGPAEEYETNLAALNALMNQGKISAGEYAEKMREVRMSYLETQDGFMAGAERGLLGIVEQAGTAADGVESALTNAFTSAGDALTEFCKTGQFDFSELASSIVADLIKITVQQGIMAPIAGWMGQGMGGGGWGGMGGAGGWIGGMVSGLLGFANGGDFEVGGVGGVDSQMVSFMATPGEKVTVHPPGRNGSSGGDGVTVNFYVTTPDAESFKRSETQIAARLSRAVGRGRRNT